MEYRHFVITLPQGIKLHLQAKISGTLSIVPAPGVDRMVDGEGSPEDSIYMKVPVGENQAEANQCLKNVAANVAQPGEEEEDFMAVAHPAQLYRIASEYGFGAKDFAFDSDYEPASDIQDPPDGYPHVPVKRISGIDGAPEVTNLYMCLIVFEHATHPENARERMLYPALRYGIPGKILKRLLDVGWLTMDEYRERLVPMDWECLARYEELCRVRRLSGKPGFLPDGQYPYRIIGCHPPMLLPERVPRTDHWENPIAFQQSQKERLQYEYQLWHPSKEERDEMARKALEQRGTRAGPAPQKEKARVWQYWELSEAEREWQKCKPEWEQFEAEMIAAQARFAAKRAREEAGNGNGVSAEDRRPEKRLRVDEGGASQNNSAANSGTGASGEGASSSHTTPARPRRGRPLVRSTQAKDNVADADLAALREVFSGNTTASTSSQTVGEVVKDNEMAGSGDVDLNAHAQSVAGFRAPTGAKRKASYEAPALSQPSSDPIEAPASSDAIEAFSSQPMAPSDDIEDASDDIMNVSSIAGSQGNEDEILPSTAPSRPTRATARATRETRTAAGSSRAPRAPAPLTRSTRAPPTPARRARGKRTRLNTEASLDSNWDL
ncbi:hypothetical protein HDZ31DRAFT_63304 [Schizophyllum fasciatum]